VPHGKINFVDFRRRFGKAQVNLAFYSACTKINFVDFCHDSAKSMLASIWPSRDKNSQFSIPTRFFLIKSEKVKTLHQK